MTTDDALRAAIWADPHDDTPRLVYADWLQEHGQEPRADFIRTQCELARADDPERRGKLARRERALWEQHRRTFRLGLPDPLRGVLFRRGFPAPVLPWLSGKRFFASHFDRLPLAPSWEISLNVASPPDLIRLFTGERMLRVAALRMTSARVSALQLFQAPHARNLTEIDWPGAMAAPADVRLLCVAGAFPHLVKLNLQNGRVGDEGAARLARSPHAARLTHLNLAGNKIGPDGAAELARGGFDSLVSLELGFDWSLHPGRGDAVAAALTTGQFPRLRRLRMFGQGLTDAALRSLAAWPGAPTLRHLELHGDAGIGAAGVRALAASPFLRDVETIDLMMPLALRHEVERILRGWLGEAVPIPNYSLGLRGQRPGVST